MKKYIVIILTLFTLISGKAYALNDKLFSACLINPLTGEIIFEHNSDKPHAMASTTKILTAIIALEKSDPNELVTVSRRAAYSEGSSAYTKEGDIYTMKELVYGLMLNSGNDAAVAIAEHISGSTEAFSQLMNDYAYKIIGVKNSYFQNPSGLDEDGHYTTAYDMALIAAYAMKNDMFREIVKTRSIAAKPQNRDEEIFYINHNKLLKKYDGCIGIKTGYTRSTGRCLVSAAERNGIYFIAVTLDDNDDWNTHTELLDLAFDEYSAKTIIRAGEPAGKCGNVQAVYSRDFVVPVKNGESERYTVIRHIADAEAVNKDEKIGFAEILFDDKNIASVDIIAAGDGAWKKGFAAVFFSILDILT